MELMMMVNSVRTAKGLRPLQYNAELEASAQAYAGDLATRRYFSHVSPEGETLKDRMERTGYRNRSFDTGCNCVKGYSLAENLARDARSAKVAMAAWMQSPAHKDAILSSEYQDVGFGIKDGIWVQHFGTVLMPIKTQEMEEIPAGPQLPSNS